MLVTGVRRRSAGVVLALAATLFPLAAALPAVASGGTTSAPVTSAAAPSPTPDDSFPVAVAITAIDPGVLRPGEDLTVAATLRNVSTSALDAVVADLRLSRYRPGSRGELSAWASGTTSAPSTRVANADPVTIPPGGAVTVRLTLPAADVRLLDQPGTWGPRGLAVEALDSAGTRLGIQRTFVLWMRDEVVPQVRVCVLAPVTGPTDDPTRLELATGSGGRLRTLADLATADAGLELAVDPALLATASAAGAHARAWAHELTAALARRDVFALPWGDTDLAAVAHAGRPDLLSAAVAASASSDLAGLAARTDVLWAPAGVLDQATMNAVAAAGARAIVAGAGTLQPAGGDASTALVDLSTAQGTLPTLVPDALLTDLLVSPDDVEPGATTVTTVQRLLAELAVLAHDGSDQPHDVLLAPGRDWTPDAALVTALFRALRSSPYSRLVPVSALLGGDDEGTARDQLPANAVDPGELSAEDVRALADARDATTSFARAIGDSGALTAGLDERVLAPLSLAWRGDANGRDALVHQVIATAADTRSGLSLTGPSSLNVISATAPVRFVVHNSLAVPASVAVQVDPHKACLRPTRSDAVTAAPGADTPVVVSLDAVANCDVAVDATLVGTDGATVGDAVGFPARVAPTIEDVGTIVVGALLALGLVLGIVRTVRRGQSARRGARQAPEEPARLPVLGGDPETAATDADPDDETGR